MGRPGTFRLGAWVDNATQPDMFLAANGQPQVLNPVLPPLQRNGEHGYYLNLQQQLTVTGGNPSLGISLFVNYVHADPHTATLSQIVSLGVSVAGPFEQRPKDTLGLAAGWTLVNPSVAEGQRLLNAAGQDPPVPVQNAEVPFELFYNFVATPWLTLGPALQYIYRPGGTSANPNVVVIGLNVGLLF
jgi:porin